MASRMLMQSPVMPKSAPLSQTTLSGVVQPVRIGFQPLVDCAPLLVAREMQLFKKHGVKVDLSCEVGWATIREKLLYGQLDAVHAIAGLALAMRLGLSNPACQVVAPFVFNLHGNAITLSRDLWNRGVRDAASLNKLIRSTPTRRFTFSTVSRFSSHYFLLRQWLIAGGIDVEKDVRIVVLPPTQMVGNLEAGLIDGGCVGEPWNSAAIARGTGWIAATSEQLAPSHPEKVLLTTEKFIHSHPDEVAAIIAEEHPAALVSISSDVLPVFREYERSMTTILNVYVAIEGIDRNLISAARTLGWLLREALRALPEAVLHVHDEVVCETDDPARTTAEMTRVMTTPPDWAAGLPLGIEIKTMMRYGK